MNELIRIKENIQSFYQKFDYCIIPLLKAFTAIITFLLINTRLGFSPIMKNPIVVLMAAVLCSFLPWTAISILAAFFVLGNLYKASMELTIIAALIFLVIALLQSAFRAKHAIIIALIPVCFCFNIPYVVPIIAGLTCGFIAIIPVVSGTVVFYLLKYIIQSAATVGADKSTDITAVLNSYASIFSGFLEDRGMLIIAAAFGIGMLVVFILKNVNIKYEWAVAAAAGLIAIFAGSMLGTGALHLPYSVGQGLTYFVLSAIPVYLFILLAHGANYSGAEHLKFEDDDYFYTVTAVPKIKSTYKTEE